MKSLSLGLSLVFALSLCTIPFTDAGVVRGVVMDGRAMEVVRLAMGRSTVLRFPNAPTKVIIGNNNYYRLEFVGNDLTLQPGRLIPTNLFVYTKAQVYGFLLTPGNRDNYDDLVTIRHKSVTMAHLGKSEHKKKILSLQVLKVARSKLKHHLLILELEIKNLSKIEIGTADLELFAHAQKKRLPRQTAVFAVGTIPPGKSAKARIFLQSEKRPPLEIELRFANQVVRQTLDKGDL